MFNVCSGINCLKHDMIVGWLDGEQRCLLVGWGTFCLLGGWGSSQVTPSVSHLEYFATGISGMVVVCSNCVVVVSSSCVSK